MSELSEKATPGPWFLEDGLVMNETRSYTVVMYGDSDQDRADAEFIAAARTGWPEALDALEQARSENEKLRQSKLLPGSAAERLAERCEAAEREAGELRERNETLTEEFTQLARHHRDCEMLAEQMAQLLGHVQQGHKPPDLGLRIQHIIGSWEAHQWPELEARAVLSTGEDQSDSESVEAAEVDTAARKRIARDQREGRWPWGRKQT